MSLKSEIEKLFKRKPPEKKPAKPVENDDKSKRIDGGDVKWESRKKILQEKDNSEVAKAYAHFKGLSETGAAVINDQIEQDKARPPANKDLGGYLIKSVLDKTINTPHPTLSVEEGIKILVQAAAIYSDPKETKKFTTPISKLLEKVDESRKITVMSEAAQQLGDSISRKDLEITLKLDQATKDLASFNNPTKKFDFMNEALTGASNRRVEASYEVFGDPMEMSDKVAKKAYEIYTELAMVPDLQQKLQNQNWLNEKQAYVSQGIDHGDSENIKYAKEVNARIETEKKNAIDKQQAQRKEEQQLGKLPDEVKIKIAEINSKLSTGYEDIGKIRARYRKILAEGGSDIDASLQSILDDLSEAMFLDPKSRSDYDKNTTTRQFNKPEDVEIDKIDKIKNRIEKSLAAGQLTSAEAGSLSSFLEALKQKTILFGKYDFENYDTLVEIGLTDPADRDYFLKITGNTEGFVTSLLASSREEQLKIINEMRVRITSIQDHMLEIANSDEKTAFEVKFSQFYHEPKYNKLIASLTDIVNKVKNREIQLSSQNRDSEITHIDSIHYDRKSCERINESIKLSEAIDLLKLQVSDERDVVRYTTNVNVIHLTHNFEAFKGYANNIDSDVINRQYINNPSMESAQHIIESRIHVEHGLNYYMAPEETLFTKNEKGYIPVLIDAQALLMKRKDILTNEFVSAKDARKLSLRALGFALGVQMSAYDVILSSGPRRAEAGRRSTGPTEQAGDISIDWTITFKRFSQNLLPDTRLYYTLIGGDKGKNPFNPRSFVNEQADADRLYNTRQQRSHGRFYSENEFEHRGIALVDSTGFALQARGIAGRGGRWRYDEGYKVFIDEDHKFETLNRLITVNPQAANAYAERWYQSGDISFEDLKKFKGSILDHLRNIAPQFAIYMERDIVYSVDRDGNYRLRELFPETANLTNEEFLKKITTEELRQLITGAEEVTEFNISHPILNAADGSKRIRTIHEIGDDMEWMKILFPNKDEYTSSEVSWMRKIKHFMVTLSQKDGIVDDVIHKGIKVKRPDTVPGAKLEGLNKTLEPWNETKHTETFPMHYQTYVDLDWEAMGHRVVGRMVGDMYIIKEHMQKFFAEQKQSLIEYQADPERAKEAKYVSLLKPYLILHEAMNMVHGDYSAEVANSSAVQASYYYLSPLISYLNSDSAARHTFGAFSWLQQQAGLSTSSWIASKTNSRKGEIDASGVRTILDKAQDMMIIAPYHGYMLSSVKSVNRVIDEGLSVILNRAKDDPIRFCETNPVWRKILPDIPTPFHNKTKFMYRDEDNKLQINFSGIKLAKPFPLNTAKLRQEHGATNFHVTIDSGIKLILSMLILLGISGVKQSAEDNK